MVANSIKADLYLQQKHLYSIMTLRVAILWTYWSGYMEACYRELASRPSVETFICMQKESGSAPFDPNSFSPKPNLLIYEKRPDAVSLRQRLSAFQPNVVLICSWHIPEYRQVARLNSSRFVRVLGMDNQWRGTAKQILGILAFRTIWRNLFDVAFVPGPRQYAFARLLGFSGYRIHLGLYSCDVGLFSRVKAQTITKRWLYIGRSAPEKGLDILISAYRRYRSAVIDPWPLVLVGAHEAIKHEPGVECVGFVQPENLPNVLAKATALVLPSRSEPHGVVVQEAAAAGLAIVCSDAVGAGDLFVRSSLNGVVCQTSSIPALAEGFIEIHRWSKADLCEASTLSRSLALQFTPRSWASTLLTLARSEHQNRQENF